MLIESSFVDKLKIQPRVSKINKSKGIRIKNYPDLVKNHYNPGFRHIINASKDINELNYIRQDTKNAFNTLTKIRERIVLCKKIGETQKTKSYYKYIKKKYIDEGLTERDVDLTIKELNKDMETISKRVKELRKGITEESMVDSFIEEDMDLLEAVQMQMCIQEGVLDKHNLKKICN